MQQLRVDQTGVRDVTPLGHLSELRDLVIDDTKVVDLRSLRDLDQLGTYGPPGLTFRNTPATARDAELARLAEIEDPQERAEQTRSYLHSLPPWPEPLPWVEEIEIDPPEIPPEAPDPDAVPRVLLSADWRVDLDHSSTTENDFADPIKQRLYAKLPEAVEKLARYHNYPEVSGPASTLKQLVNVPFEDADMLDIHLQLGALTDVKEANNQKREIERLDADCMAALNGVLRLGPPVTMGHPDVELLEKRSIEYARSRLPAKVAESERRLADGLARNHTIATQRARDMARQVAMAGDEGRVAGYRRAFVRNVAIALGVLADAATGFVAGEIVVAAAQFLVLHKDAIMAIAPGWGETGYKWAEYLITKADQILRDAARAP